MPKKPRKKANESALVGGPGVASAILKKHRAAKTSEQAKLKKIKELKMKNALLRKGKTKNRPKRK